MEQVMLEKLAEGGTVSFSPKGKSMLPMLRDAGDSVTLKKPPARMKRGMVALFLSSDSEEKRFILHRLVAVRKDMYIFCGDNRVTCDSPVPYENILGVVSGYTHCGNRHELNEFKYRLYKNWMVATYRIRPVSRRALNLMLRIWRKLRRR